MELKYNYYIIDFDSNTCVWKIDIIDIVDIIDRPQLGIEEHNKLILIAMQVMCIIDIP